MRRVRPQPLAARPRVSVVIACYNYGRYLRQAARSVLTQEGVDLDLIIVDGGSTDETPEVCAEIAAKDDRVKVVRMALNNGAAATFNTGIEASTGEYVKVLAADDLLAAGSLARGAAVLEANPEVGLVYGGARTFRGRSPRPPVRQRAWAWTIWSGPEWSEKYLNNAGEAVSGPEVLFRAAILRDVGGYPQLPYTMDISFYLALASRAGVAYVHGCDQAYMRDHQNRLTKLTHLRTLAERVRAFELFAATHAGADAGRLLSIGRHGVARNAIAHAAAVRDCPGGEAEAAELADFAVRLEPEIRATPQWSRYEQRGPDGGLRRGALRRWWENRVTLTGLRLRWQWRWLVLTALPTWLATRPVLYRLLYRGM